MFRNVLVGVDGSASAELALREAIDIARESSGRLGLVTVASQPSPWIALPPFALGVTDAQLAVELEAEAVRQLDEAERSVPADVPVTKLVAHGRAADVLTEQAQTGPWDLIVIGHRASSDRRGLGRRVGAALLRSSPVPVLIVRGEARVGASADERAASAPRHHAVGFAA